MDKPDSVKILAEIIALTYTMGAEEDGSNPYFEMLDDNTKEVLKNFFE